MEGGAGVVIAAGQLAPRGLGVLQPGTDLGGEVIEIDDPRSCGCIEQDDGVRQQGLLGVGDPGQVAGRGRLGVQHPHRGDLPPSQSVGQPVGIDEVFGTPPSVGAGPSGEVVRCVSLQGGQL